MLFGGSKGQNPRVILVLSWTGAQAFVIHKLARTPHRNWAAPHKHLVRFNLIYRTSRTEGFIPLPATHVNLWFMLLPLVDDSSQKQVT